MFDELPGHLFKDHDVPVDIIVTPDHVFEVIERLKKPNGIFWSKLSPEKIKQVPLLQQLAAKAEQQKYDTEDPPNSKKKSKKENSLGFNVTGIPKGVRISEFKEAVRKTGANMTFVTWKAYKQSALVFFDGQKQDVIQCLENLEINGSKLFVSELGNYIKETKISDEKPSSDSIPKKANKNEFGIFFGKVPKSCKKSEFRKLLADRGVIPDHLNWNGRNGYASAFWGENNEQIIDLLCDLRIGDHKIAVELFKRNLPEKLREKVIENIPTSNISNNNLLYKTELEIDINNPTTAVKEIHQLPKTEDSKIDSSISKSLKKESVETLDTESVNQVSKPNNSGNSIHLHEMSCDVNKENQLMHIEENYEKVLSTCSNGSITGESGFTTDIQSLDDSFVSDDVPSSVQSVATSAETNPQALNQPATIPSYCDKIRDFKHPQNPLPPTQTYPVVTSSIIKPPSKNFADVNQVKCSNKFLKF